MIVARKNQQYALHESKYLGLRNTDPNTVFSWVTSGDGTDRDFQIAAWTPFHYQIINGDSSTPFYLPPLRGNVPIFLGMARGLNNQDGGATGEQWGKGLVMTEVNAAITNMGGTADELLKAVSFGGYAGVN